MVAIPKFELTKVRGVVTIPNYLHMALVPMTRYAETNSLQVFNNISTEQQYKALNELVSRPTCALDQSAFDHNCSLNQLLIVAETLPMSSYFQFLLCGSQITAQAGTRAVIVRNGMPSGFPNTAIFDSLINIG